MTAWVIIGAGEAGARAALDLRGRGEVTLISDERHQPYERPPLSKPGPDGVTLKPIAPEGALDDVRFRSGVRVTAIDRAARRFRLADGETIPYDRLLLATGASPRPLPCKGGENALLMRRFDEAEAIFARAASAKQAVIIGAGLIGLELAAVLAGSGVAVTVLEAAPRALGRALAPKMAEILVERHRAEGVTFRFGARISHLTPEAVHLEGGEMISADLIIAAIGVTPNTALAEAAGLRCENGVSVGPNLATEDPAIFAAGDCACLSHPLYGPTRFEAWRVAVEVGAAAAEAMAGTLKDFAPLPWFWSDQYDLGLQMAGFHNPNHRNVERKSDGATVIFELSGEGHLTAAAGIGPGNSVAKDIKTAERMITSRARPDLARLADPGYPMKKLMREGAV